MNQMIQIYRSLSTRFPVFQLIGNYFLQFLSLVGLGSDPTGEELQNGTHCSCGNSLVLFCFFLFCQKVMSLRIGILDDPICNMQYILLVHRVLAKTYMQVRFRGLTIYPNLVVLVPQYQVQGFTNDSEVFLSTGPT